VKKKTMGDANKDSTVSFNNRCTEMRDASDVINDIQTKYNVDLK